jgi:GH35 family endo-1,4-beta-xylanase
MLAAPLTKDQILNEADARIEAHRKGDITLKLTTEDGTPLEGGVNIRIEQTRHAFLFGCNIFALNRLDTPEDNKAYADHFADLLNFATLPFYWWAYERKPGEYQDDRTRELIDFCQQHDITTKGHPLMWNWHDPKWLPDDTELAWIGQMSRIGRCTTTFKDGIGMWDVVNEATHYNRPGPQQDAPILTRMIRERGVGPTVRQAFKAARQGNPDATLLINDYRNGDGYVFKVLEELVDDEGKPMYDVIGIQSHQHGSAWPVEQIWNVCERFARYGKPLHFTETTFVSGEQGWDLQNARRKTDPDFVWTSTPEGEKRQADDAVKFYTTLFSHPAVEAITWWDFCDQRAWQGAPSGLLRADVTPKPAYTELRKLIKGKWWTREEVQTDSAGQVKLRGFFGQYRVRVNRAGGRWQGTFELRRDTKDALTVKLSEVPSKR